MFSGAFVGNDNKFNFVSLLENLSSFHFARVKEQLLALVHLVAQESELT